MFLFLWFARWRTWLGTSIQSQSRSSIGHELLSTFSTPCKGENLRAKRSRRCLRRQRGSEIRFVHSYWRGQGRKGYTLHRGCRKVSIPATSCELSQRFAMDPRQRGRLCTKNGRTTRGSA